jgi:hypothetical protein
MDIACKEYLGECDKFTNKHHKDSNPLNNNPLELERIQLLETYKYISFLYNNFGEKMKLGQNKDFLKTKIKMIIIIRIGVRLHFEKASGEKQKIICSIVHASSTAYDARRKI